MDAKDERTYLVEQLWIFGRIGHLVGRDRNRDVDHGLLLLGARFARQTLGLGHGDALEIIPEEIQPERLQPVPHQAFVRHGRRLAKEGGQRVGRISTTTTGATDRSCGLWQCGSSTASTASVARRLGRFHRILPPAEGPRCTAFRLRF